MKTLLLVMAVLVMAALASSVWAASPLSDDELKAVKGGTIFHYCNKMAMCYQGCVTMFAGQWKKRSGQYLYCGLAIWGNCSNNEPWTCPYKYYSDDQCQNEIGSGSDTEMGCIQ